VWVLIVEDEKRMAETLRKGLDREGMSIALAFDGPSALEAALGRDFDVIVLDIMLPGLTGLQVTRKLRAQGVGTPILMLTARDTSADIVDGLSQGADDYLTKPFAFEVLLARLHALSRRGIPSRPSQLRYADLALDPITRDVSRGDRKLSLTRTEYILLEMLLRRSGMVLSRETLIEGVWGFEAEVENNTLEVFIGQLRAKVDRDSSNKLIHTIRGVGYVLRDDEAK
jgi:DNA-binding response OmpR family regulator